MVAPLIGADRGITGDLRHRPCLVRNAPTVIAINQCQIVKRLATLGRALIQCVDEKIILPADPCGGRQKIDYRSCLPGVRLGRDQIGDRIEDEVQHGREKKLVVGIREVDLAAVE